MRERNEYCHGDHNVICDYSGFKVKRSQCQITWDGYLVRKELWEPRHSQDLVKGVKENQSVPDPRPEGDNDFLTTNEITQDNL